MNNTFQATSYVYISEEDFQYMLNLVENEGFTPADAFNMYGEQCAEINSEIINSIRNNVIAELRNRIAVKESLSVPYHIEGVVKINGGTLNRIFDNVEDLFDEEDEPLEETALDVIGDSVFNFLEEEYAGLGYFPSVTEPICSQIFEKYKLRFPNRQFS